MTVFLVAYLLHTGDYVQIALLSEARAITFLQKKKEASIPPSGFLDCVSDRCHTFRFHPVIQSGLGRRP